MDRMSTLEKWGRQKAKLIPSLMRLFLVVREENGPSVDILSQVIEYLHSEHCLFMPSILFHQPPKCF